MVLYRAVPQKYPAESDKLVQEVSLGNVADVRRPGRPDKNWIVHELGSRSSSVDLPVDCGLRPLVMAGAPGITEMKQDCPGSSASHTSFLPSLPFRMGNVVV